MTTDFDPMDHIDDDFLEAIGDPPPQSSRRDTNRTETCDTTEQIFNLTDVGNGKRLVAHYGVRIRYCHNRGKWLLYDGTRWAWDERGEIYWLAKETIRTIYREAGDAANPRTRVKIAEHAKRSEADPRIKAMVSQAKSEPTIPVKLEDFDADPMKFNVRNGTIDLLTGSLLPHDPSDLITRLAPVTFDQEATSITWYIFLSRIMNGNKDLLRFLQRFFGYALTGKVAEQCLLLAYGTGSNGKSTLIETIRKILGDYAATSDFQTFAVRKNETVNNDLARLIGARLVTAAEGNDGLRFDEGIIKRVTGGDTITTRFLYNEYFEYQPQFKLILGTNHKPRIRGTDHSIWRRMRLLPFTVTIPDEEQDKSLAEKLLVDSPGILNWILRGCSVWQQDGLGLPEEVKNATAEYRSDEDMLSGFIADRCIVVKTAKETASDLYKAHKEWAEGAGERPVSKITLGKRLAERGFEQDRGSRGVRGWRGIRLRNAADDACDTLPEETPREENSKGLRLNVSNISSLDIQKIWEGG